MNSESAIARKKLAADLRAVIADTEELLKATAGQAGDKIQSARTRVEETLRSARARIDTLEDSAMENVKASAKATDQYVHENPWQLIGIAAGMGLIFGWLLGRK
ncbi:MAG: DUF883 domain-containing protein [Spirochaetae bacterium HGW-Spirochaetae-5]|nr:MAG: DUF883 domain-containing protein [Spirochaetae bacterium HGW-Spirochaetae-5]